MRNRELKLQFLAELMLATQDASTPEAFQQATQAYFDALFPWLDPHEYPTVGKANFPVFANCDIDEVTDFATVQLSPESEAFFHAWLRRETFQRNGGGPSSQN